MTLDPTVLELRRGLRPYLRRLWLRRVVRDGVRLVAVLAAAELLLAVAARITPLEWAPQAAAGLVIVTLLALLVDAARVRPSLTETALALDAEQGLRDRLSSALALAARDPDLAMAERPAEDGLAEAETMTQAERYEQLVRLQRRDALRTLSLADRRAFRPRHSRRAVSAAAICAVLLVPALLFPNPQAQVLARREAQRDAAQQQARKLEETATRIAEGRTSPDPRADIAEELRRLARELRDRPEDLDRQLARLGSLEDALRSRIDPGAEQRAAAITSLSRSLSRLSTGSDSNPEGDPKKAGEDLDKLGSELGGKTPDERAEIARQLSELESVARQAGAEAQSALHDAASAVARGDTQGAQEALGRLGEALDRGQQQVDLNRDLASAANDLQDARRALAGQQGQAGQGQAGQGQPGQGQPGQGQQGQGQQGQGQGQGQGSLGGGGSNARYLGSGNGGQSGFGGPTTGNRQFGTGDLDSIYADFDRLGRPSDPSYIAGSGGTGQTQQGSGQGQGTNNDAFVPYTDVYQDFYDFAITSLDRSYVPVDVKDYVRDYFSTLGGGEE
ncbi:MAG TPA: hypothetical protein VGP30_03110 [Candidatus Limnocylindrales bacterium]|nr:hypothetical protein [Candidatus Limnocylindrales bacterium]